MSLLEVSLAKKEVEYYSLNSSEWMANPKNIKDEHLKKRRPDWFIKKSFYS